MTATQHGHIFPSSRESSGSQSRLHALAANDRLGSNPTAVNTGDSYRLMSGGTNLLNSRENMEKEFSVQENNSLHRLSRKEQNTRGVYTAPTIGQSCVANVPLENKLVIVSVRSCAEFPQSQSQSKEASSRCTSNKHAEMSSHMSLDEVNKICSLSPTKKYIPYNYAASNEQLVKEIKEGNIIKDNKLDDFVREEKGKLKFAHKPPSAIKNDSKPLKDVEKLTVSFGNPMCTIIKISPKKDSEPTKSERIRKRRKTNAASQEDVLNQSRRRSERLKKCDHMEKHEMPKDKIIANDTVSVAANSSPVRNSATSMAYIKPLMIRLKRSRVPIDDAQMHVPVLPPKKLDDSLIGKPKNNSRNSKKNQTPENKAKLLKSKEFSGQIEKSHDVQQSNDPDHVHDKGDKTDNVSEQKNNIKPKSIGINEKTIKKTPAKRARRVRDSSANKEKSKKKVKLKITESTEKGKRRNSIAVSAQEDITGSLAISKSEIVNMRNAEKQNPNITNKEIKDFEKPSKNNTNQIDNLESNQSSQIPQKPQRLDSIVFTEKILETRPTSEPLKTNLEIFNNKIDSIQDESFPKTVKQRELRKRAKSMALSRLKESLLEMVNMSSEESVKTKEDLTVPDATTSSLLDSVKGSATKETKSNLPEDDLAKNSSETIRTKSKEVHEQSLNAETIDCLLESAINIILDTAVDESHTNKIDGKMTVEYEPNNPVSDLEYVSKSTENEKSERVIESTGAINDVNCVENANKKEDPILRKDADSEKVLMKMKSVEPELTPKSVEKEMVKPTKSVEMHECPSIATAIGAAVKKVKIKEKPILENKREKEVDATNSSSELKLNLDPSESITKSIVNEAKLLNSDTLTVKIPLTAMLSVGEIKKDSKLNLVRKDVAFELPSKGKRKLQSSLSNVKTEGKASDSQSKSKEAKTTDHGSSRSCHVNEKIPKRNIEIKSPASKPEAVDGTTVNSSTVDKVIRVKLVEVPDLKNQPELTETPQQQQQQQQPAEIDGKLKVKRKTNNTASSKSTDEFGSTTTKKAAYSFVIPSEIPVNNEESKIFDNVENMIEFNSEIMKSLTHHVHEMEPPEVAATEVVITETEVQHAEELSICSALQSTIESVAAEKAIFATELTLTSPQQHQQHQQAHNQKQQKQKPLMQSKDYISISSGTAVGDELDIYSPSTSLTLLANTAASTAPIPARRHSCVIVVPSMSIINGDEQPLMGDLIMQETPCNSQQYTFSDIAIPNAAVVPPIVDTVIGDVVKVTESPEMDNIEATQKENEQENDVDGFEVIKLPVKDVEKVIENNAEDNDDEYGNDNKSVDNMEEGEDADENDYVLSVGENERFIGIPTISKDGSYSYMNIEATPTVPAYLFNGESRDVPTPTPTPTVNVYAPTTVTAVEPTVFNDDELAVSHEMYVSAPETPSQINPLETCNNDSVIITSDHEVSSTQETEFEPTRRGSTISNQMKSCTNNIEATSPLMQDNQVDTTNIHLLQNKRRRTRKYSTYDDVSDHIYPTPEGKRRKTFCTDLLSQMIVTGNDSLFESRFKHSTISNIDNGELSTASNDKLRTAHDTCSSNQCIPTTTPRRRGRKPKNTTPASNTANTANETSKPLDTGMESVTSQYKARSHVKKTQLNSDANSRQSAAADLYAFREDASSNCDSPTTMLSSRQTEMTRHTYVKSPATQVFVPPDMERILDIYQEENIISEDNQDTSETAAAAAAAQKHYMTLNGAKLKVLPTRTAKLDKSPKRCYTPKTTTTTRRRR